MLLIACSVIELSILHVSLIHFLCALLEESASKGSTRLKSCIIFAETTSPSTVTQSSSNITPSRSESITAVTSGEDNDRARAASKRKRTEFDYVAVVLSVLGVVAIALLFLALVFWRR